MNEVMAATLIGALVGALSVGVVQFVLSRDRDMRERGRALNLLAFDFEQKLRYRETLERSNRAFQGLPKDALLLVFPHLPSLPDVVAAEVMTVAYRIDGWNALAEALTASRIKGQDAWKELRPRGDPLWEQLERARNALEPHVDAVRREAWLAQQPAQQEGGEDYR